LKKEGFNGLSGEYERDGRVRPGY
jgi:hypothetical protein